HSQLITGTTANTFTGDDTFLGWAAGRRHRLEVARRRGISVGIRHRISALWVPQSDGHAQRHLWPKPQPPDANRYQGRYRRDQRSDKLLLAAVPITWKRTVSMTKPRAMSRGFSRASLSQRRKRPNRCALIRTRG